MTRKRILLLAFFCFIFLGSPFILQAKIIKGYIRDIETHDPLPGAAVLLSGTGRSAMTDETGYYELDVTGYDKGSLELYYISYETLVTGEISFDETLADEKNFMMKSESVLIDEVVLVERKNAELQTVLMNDRKVSTKAIENIGAAEMSIKGLSNAAEAMETMTGVSFADAGQLFVRGLGDRYSLTTLNGLPIASPNPDNKLIPLDIFPSSTIKSVTVSKVYDVSSFADYSGARIDIGTKENVGETFFSVSLGFSGNFNTTFSNFYTSSRHGSMFVDNNLPDAVKSLSPSGFSEYVRTKDPFRSSFNIGQGTALPGISGTVSGGTTFELKNGDELSLLASFGIGNDRQTIRDAFITNLTAQGTVLNSFDYDSYERSVDISGLFSLNYLFENGGKIGYNMIYSKTSTDEYKLRSGFDSEKNNLLGSNSVAHSYSLFNNQLHGIHPLGKNWELVWKGSYGMTASNEPDRKQVMYRRGESGNLSLFKLNQQETMRYFGELTENEFIADLSVVHAFLEKSKLRFGVAYKDKSRDYSSTRFYYDLDYINPEITDIYNPSFLDWENVSSGLIPIIKDAQPKDSYFAGHDIIAGFADVEYYPIDRLMLSLGVRYEYSHQWVNYWDDASIERMSVLNSGDFFPALNVKFDINDRHALRFAASITVTRPSFIEMAPFLYRESYGSAEIRGNENLKNGYNYNFDLKYEYFSKDNRDMFSVGVYYKILKTPIERIQESSGGAVVYSFRNAEQGIAAGIEAEFKKTIGRYLQVGANASLMYTDVVLMANGGIYTDSRRALQGASPYLANAYVTYAPEFRNGSSLSMSLMYNLQGPRIHTVGVYGLGNVTQKTFHTLDFNMIYRVTPSWSIDLSLENLLDSEMSFSQEVKTTGENIKTESYRFGRGIQLGISYNF